MRKFFVIAAVIIATLPHPAKCNAPSEISNPQIPISPNPQIPLEIFPVFVKINLLTFGGGLAMITVLEQETVANREWLTHDEVGEVVAMAEIIPGPLAVNMATFTGWKRWKFPGAALAVSGLVVPSLVVMITIALFFAGFAKNRWVGAALKGIRPAVIGLISAAAFSLGVIFLFPKNGNEAVSLWQVPDLATTGLFVVLMAVEWRFKPHPIALIGVSVAAGMLLFGVLL